MPMPTRRAIVAALTSGAIAGNGLLPRTKQVCILLKVAAGILLAMLAAANIPTNSNDARDGAGKYANVGFRVVRVDKQ